MSGDGSNTSSYAPRSPDLSSFYSSSPTGAAEQIQPPGPLVTAGYKLEPPAYAYASPHAASSLYTPSSSAPPPTTTISSTTTSTTGFTFASSATSQHCPRERYTPPQFITGRPSRNTLSQPQPHLQPQPQPPPPTTTIQPPSHGQPVSHHPTSSSSSSYSSSYSSSSPSSLPPNMPPRKAAPPPPPAPVIEPSPVKTKFPTARIKRIMQADEEVGKVAQQTPIAVGKALELFMIQLVSKSADVAKEKGSKRVTSSMLKQVVEMDEQWDFLRDIVSRVETEKEGSKSKSKAESESDEEMVVVEEPKKKGRGGRRKKAT